MFKSKLVEKIVFTVLNVLLVLFGAGVVVLAWLSSRFDSDFSGELRPLFLRIIYSIVAFGILLAIIGVFGIVVIYIDKPLLFSIYKIPLLGGAAAAALVLGVLVLVVIELTNIAQKNSMIAMMDMKIPRTRMDDIEFTRNCCGVDSQMELYGVQPPPSCCSFKGYQAARDFYRDKDTLEYMVNIKCAPDSVYSSPCNQMYLYDFLCVFEICGSLSDSEAEAEEGEPVPPRARPESLRSLTKATRFTESELKRIYRGFKAECPSGLVREDTFRSIYSQFFPQGANSSQYATYVFHTLDQANTGTLSFQDLVRGLSVLCRGSVEERLKWTFTLYDINKDGKITRDELADVITSVYSLLGRLSPLHGEDENDPLSSKIDAIFQRLDQNNDGVVTWEEFFEACTSDETITSSMAVFDSAI